MADPAKTVDQNLLPVQAYFNLDGSFNTFIGQGQPFYATANPLQSGLTITNSTLDSSPIGSTSPSTGVFTNISTTTGTISTTPSSATDIANKFYVDTVAQGLGPKAACAVGTTVNITLSGLQTIDSYTTLSGDRVLVKNQSSSQFNGIYIASASAWTRSTDMDVWSEVPGAYTVLLNGGQADTGWVCTATQSGTINVTAMPWVQFSGANTYYAGTGLTLASNTFSITNTGVSASTYGSASVVPVLAVNAQGQITSASNSTISIAPSQINATIPNSGLTNSSITVNGNAIALGGSATITAINPFALTIGTGLTGTSYNGSVATTITIDSSVVTLSGTQTLTNKTLTAPVISTITNTGTLTLPTSTDTLVGRATSDTLTNKTIAAGSNTITGLTNSNLSGTAGITNANLANSSITVNSTSISLGGSGTITANTTNTLTIGTGLSGTSFNGSSAVTIANTGVLSFSAGTTGFTPSTATTGAITLGGTLGLTNGGTNASLTAVAGAVPYSTASALALTAAGTTGQVLTSNGSSAPTWTTITASIGVTDDTTSNVTEYGLFGRVTSGTLATVYTASTQVRFNPSTGVYSAPIFSGSGASLTSIPNSALVNSTISGISLGSNLATLTIGTGLSGTSYNGSTAITIANSGVTSITGTASQITASASTGAVTLSLPSTINVNTSGTAANVTGTVAIANGGTGQTTASTAFNALSPITTTGDLIIGNGTNSATRLGIGSNGTILQSNGTTASWVSFTGGATITPTTSSATYYIVGTTSTSGSLSTAYISNTNSVNYNANTGDLTSPQFVASNGLHINSNAIATSYTIGTGYNAVSAGPITVNSGVTVTVATDSSWSIV